MDDSVRSAYQKATPWRKLSSHFFIGGYAALPILIIGVPAFWLFGWPVRYVFAVAWLVASLVAIGYYVHVHTGKHDG